MIPKEGERHGGGGIRVKKNDDAEKQNTATISGLGAQRQVGRLQDLQAAAFVCDI